MSPSASRTLNLALYQVGWLCCVLGGAHGWPVGGAIAGCMMLAIHLALLAERRGELKLLAIAGALGVLVDSAQSCSGLLEFRSGHVAGCLAPPWILVMWLQFATLFRFGLRFLQDRLLLAASLGAVGGPLAFWTGERLGAVTFASPPWKTLWTLCIVWAVACPTLAWAASRIGDAPGYGRRSGPRWYQSGGRDSETGR